MGRIVAIANQKGGVGKTTTAVNLAACLALLGEPTLVVDCDPQGNATSGMGVELGREQAGLYQVLIGSAQAAEAVTPTGLEHLFIVGANADLAGAEVELSQTPGWQQVLKSHLVPLCDQYKYIFLDCPPSLGLLTLNALTSCAGVLIPLQCEYYALEGLTRLLQTVARVRRSWNHDLSLEGIALTMFDVRNNLAKQVADDVRGHLGSLVYDSVVPRNVRLSESPSHGLPVALYDPGCSGAKAYMALAREFRQGPRRQPGQEAAA